MKSKCKWFICSFLFEFISFVCIVNGYPSNTTNQTASSKTTANFLPRTFPRQNCKRTTYGFRCEKLTFTNGEFKFFPNGTVHVYSINFRVDRCYYDSSSESVVICKPGTNIDVETLEIPCGVQLALIISVISVVLPLFFSMLTEDVRDLTHVNLRGLIISVFFFHFLLQIVNLDEITDVPEFRYTFPALLHFFTLVLLSWMTIFSHDGMMMGEAVVDNSANYMELMRNYKGYLLSVLTTIILLITVTMITEILGMIPDSFRPKSGDFCWLTQKTLLIFFTGPVVAFSSINYLNFISAYFYFTRQDTAFRDGPVLVLKKNYLVHFKLFVIMDITWFLGVLIFLTEVEWLWRVFVVIFILQESFIVVVPFNKCLEEWVLNKLSGS